MLHQIEVHKISEGLRHTFNLPRMGASPRFKIIDITGLDPVDANVLTGSYSHRDQHYFQAANLETRNIIITIEYDYNPSEDVSVQNLRRELYSIFTPKAYMSLVFRDGGRTKVTYGYVESHTTSMFTKTPRAQVSIICPDPYLSELTVTTHEGVSGPSSSFPYDGDVPTGFGLRVTYQQSSAVTNIFINGEQHMRVGHQFLAGDELLISTTPGNKYIRRRRSGASISILESVVDGDFSMKLTPGGAFGVQSSGNSTYSINYLSRYSGL